jgi:hypothetical protein
VILQKLREQTILEFPDGKAAIVEMEGALLSCDHYESVSGGAYVEEEISFGVDEMEDDDVPPPPSQQHPLPPGTQGSHNVAWSRKPPPAPEEGEVISYGPDGQYQSQPATGLPGLMEGQVGAAAVSDAPTPRRLKLNLANMGNLG